MCPVPMANNLNRVQVGFLAPLFNLPEAGGEFIDLKNYQEKIKFGVVFLWDVRVTECQSFINKLNLFKENLPEFELFAISIEDREYLLDLKKKLNLNYHILYDPDSVTIKKYSMYDSSSERGQPYPSLFLVDKQRVIRYKWVDKKTPPALPDLKELIQMVNNF